MLWESLQEICSPIRCLSTGKVYLSGVCDWFEKTLADLSSTPFHPSPASATIASTVIDKSQDKNKPRRGHCCRRGSASSGVIVTGEQCIA
jgi:hypothetical protein